MQRQNESFKGPQTLMFQINISMTDGCHFFYSVVETHTHIQMESVLIKISCIKTTPSLQLCFTGLETCLGGDLGFITIYL